MYNRPPNPINGPYQLSQKEYYTTLPLTAGEQVIARLRVEGRRAGAYSHNRYRYTNSRDSI